MNNGNQESKIENKLNQYESEINTIVENIGISYIKDQESIEALKLTYDQLKNMDQQECVILSYKLGQYGMYIQSVQNRLNNIKDWCQETLNYLVGIHSQEYSTFVKFEEKKSCVIKENSVAQQLNIILLKTQGKSQELYNIANKIQHLSKVLLELSQSKRFANNG